MAHFSVMWLAYLACIAAVAEAACLGCDQSDNAVILLQTQHSLQMASATSAMDSFKNKEHNEEHILNHTALSAIDNALERPLIKSNRLQDSQVQFNMSLAPSASKTTPVICHNFHKTGCEICMNFLKIWQEQSLEPHQHCGEGAKSQMVCPIGSGLNWWHQALTAASVQKSIGEEDFRMLNWIRQPHSLIVSAFRYHMQSPEQWEKEMETSYQWYTVPESDRAGNSQDNDVIFGACDHHCTYLQLLKSVAAVNETLGVIIEGLDMRSVLNNMVDLTYAYLNDPRVLHLSLDHLAKDFQGTMRCINTFLRGKSLTLEQLDAFNIMQRVENDPDPHTTRGKYDNTFIEQTLLSFPNWSSSFLAFSSLMSKLFKRQADMYGCPMP